MLPKSRKVYDLDENGERIKLPFYPRHGVPGASRGSHFRGRSCFQSLYRADVGRSDGDLPKWQVQAGFQLRHAAVSQRTPAGFYAEDTKAGMIQAYLDKYTGNMVCSKQLYKEALNHAFDEPKQWEIREINEIMNQCIDRWRYFPNPRMFSEYGRQKGWERENPATDSGNPSEKTMDGFVEVTEQMELPF